VPDKKESSAAAFASSLTVEGGQIVTDSHDASGKQVRKCKGIVRSNFDIAKRALRVAAETIVPAARTRHYPLAQRSEWCPKVRWLEVVQRWKSTSRLIDRSVEFDGQRRWEEHLKSGYVGKREPEESEPINQTVIGKPTHGMQLIETRTERFFPERAIETVRNVGQTVFGHPRRVRHVGK
jgi:hypothetical protein